MNKKDTCEIYCFDEEKVDRIQADLKVVDLSAATQLLKALADENRTKIAYALCLDEELCVCDIANIVGTTVANTSQHLRKLHKQGIVKYRREGKLAFYSLSDRRIQELMKLMLVQKDTESVNA